MQAFLFHQIRRPVIPIGLMLAIVGSSETWAQQDTRFYHGHMWDGGWYGWLFGPMMMIPFIALLVVAVIFIARWLGADNRDISSGRIPDKTPLDILKERFARGEIDKDEFEERRKLLE